MRGTALKRARVRGLVRNLMVVVGNSGLAGLAGKVRSFLTHPDAEVRSHARWALDKLESGTKHSHGNTE
jgi:epoxyqueuosine reductase QueG